MFGDVRVLETDADKHPPLTCIAIGTRTVREKTRQGKRAVAWMPIISVTRDYAESTADVGQ